MPWHIITARLRPQLSVSASGKCVSCLPCQSLLSVAAGMGVNLYLGSRQYYGQYVPEQLRLFILLLPTRIDKTNVNIVLTTSDDEYGLNSRLS